MGLLIKLFMDFADEEFKLAQDLVAMAIADGEISDAERNLINEICHKEVVSKKKVIVDEREQSVRRWINR